MVTRRVVVSFSLAVVSLLLAGDVSGQVASAGSIRGYVRDQQGLAIPGVTVTASSAQAPVPYSTATDTTGHYRIDGMLPGTYNLTVQVEGFSTYRRDDVELRAGLNLTLDIVMTAGNVADTVMVTAESPMLESRNPTQAVNVTGAFQTSLPTSNRTNWSDVLTFTPGTVVLDRGAVQGGISEFYVHGSNFASHVIQIDGVDVTAAGGLGTRGHVLGAGSLEDTQVKLAGMDASSPLGYGALINMVPRSGTDQLHGAFGLTGQSRRWADSNVPGGTAGKINLVQPEVALGGPLVRGRAWYFASYRVSSGAQDVSRSAQDVASVRSVFPDAAFPSIESTIHQTLTRVSLRPSPAHAIDGIFTSGRDLSNSPTLPPVSLVNTVRALNGGETGSLRWRGAWDDRLATSVSIVYNNNRFESVLSVDDRPRREIFRTTTLAGGFFTGNTRLALFDALLAVGQVMPSDKLTIAADATYLLNRGLGRHEVQVGTFLQPKRRFGILEEVANDGFVLEQLVLRNPNDPSQGFVPFYRQFIDPNAPRVVNDRASTDYAFYVQDSWRPSGRLTVHAGVRVDFINTRDRVAEAPLRDTTAVGPRFGATYLLTADGRNVVRASWGRIHAQPGEGGASPLGSVAPASEDRYDLDLDGTFETVFTTPAQTSVTTSRRVDLEGLRQPRADEWTIGYQRQLPGRTTLDVSLVRRAYRDNIINVEVNGIYENGVFRGYRDEAFNAINVSTSNIWNWPVYTGISLTAAKRTSDLQLIASYTRQFMRLEGTWQPNDVFSFLQPDAFPDDKAGGRGQRDHLVAAGATYTAPWGITVATNVNIQSGQWSGPVTMQIPAADAVGPPTVRLSNGRVVPNPLATRTRFAFATRGAGQLKGEWVPEWNLRLGRRFRTHGVTWQPAVDVLNVINTGRSGLIVSASMADANFGRLAATRVPPRAAQVSVRVDF